MRAANITEEQADIFAEVFEQQQQTIQAQSLKLDNLENKELATKKDIELAIAALKHDTLKFVVWTGVGVVFTLSGVVFTLLKPMIH